MKEEPARLIESRAGRPLAVRTRSGIAPAIVFLPGYASDMGGTKALALEEWAARRGRALVRFDYSGTGASPGKFEDGTLDLWLEDTLAVLDELSGQRAILAGSSMGGWLAMHAALRRPKLVAAVVGIAAAPDFTEWGFTSGQKAELQTLGYLKRASRYGPDQVTTAAFWQSGQQLRLLESTIDVTCPVRLIHGARDEDVPLPIAFRLMERLRSADVQLTVVKGGGHRLSEPHEIEMILRTVAALVEPLS